MLICSCLYDHSHLTFSVGESCLLKESNCFNLSSCSNLYRSMHLSYFSVMNFEECERFYLESFRFALNFEVDSQDLEILNLALADLFIS